MKELPILMSDAMVRAVANGTKTQTRRIIKPQPDPFDSDKYQPTIITGDESGYGRVNVLLNNCRGEYKGHMQRYWARRIVECDPLEDGEIFINSVACPFGQPGDRLWVRERTRVLLPPYRGRLQVRYEADGAEAMVTWPDRLKPVPVGNCIPNGCHREAARSILTITDVRVQRLQDISEEDATAEGAEALEVGGEDNVSMSDFSHRDGFARLWESIYGSGSWASNPWVWALTFEKVKPCP